MGELWRRIRKDKVSMASLVVIVLVIAVAVFAPWLAPYDPNEQFFDGLTLEGQPLPPDARFWFGTDTLGRDQLSRLLYGARTSLLIGIIANGAASRSARCWASWRAMSAAGWVRPSCASPTS